MKSKVNYSAKAHSNRLLRSRDKNSIEWVKFRDQNWLPLTNSTKLLQVFVVGRACLYIENQLDDLIKLLCPNPSVISKKSTFTHKVKLLSTLSPLFEKSYSPQFYALNELRNKVIHNLDYQVTKDDVKKIFQSNKAMRAKFRSNRSNINNLMRVVEYIIGHFAGYKSIVEADPALALIVFAEGEIKKSNLAKNIEKVIDTDSYIELLKTARYN